MVRIKPLEPTGPQVRAAIDAFAPDLVHVTSPGSLGRKALKHTDRAGIPSLVVEQSPVLDLAADYWRAKVADRTDAVLVTSTWMVERMAEFGVTAGLWRPGVDTAAFTPGLRDHWLHDSWSRARSAVGTAGRGRLRRQPPQASRRTSPRRAGLGPRHPPGDHRRRLAARVARDPAARRPRSPAPCRPAT